MMSPDETQQPEGEDHLIYSGDRTRAFTPEQESGIRDIIRETIRGGEIRNVFHVEIAAVSDRARRRM